MDGGESNLQLWRGQYTQAPLILHRSPFIFVSFPHSSQLLKKNNSWLIVHSFLFNFPIITNIPYQLLNHEDINGFCIWMLVDVFSIVSPLKTFPEEYSPSSFAWRADVNLPQVPQRVNWVAGGNEYIFGTWELYNFPSFFLIEEE